MLVDDLLKFNTPDAFLKAILCLQCASGMPEVRKTDYCTTWRKGLSTDEWRKAEVSLGLRLCKVTLSFCQDNFPPEKHALSPPTVANNIDPRSPYKTITYQVLLHHQSEPTVRNPRPAALLPLRSTT